MKPHPIGTIAVPCGALARYSRFTRCLSTVDYPEGTFIHMVESMDVTSSLNAIIREMQGEWLWIMGDDHTFEKDMLLALLDREVDVVVPLCAKKAPPFRLVAFSDSEMQLHEADGIEYPHYTYLELDSLPKSGLVEVHAAGSAGMLVRKHVLDAIGEPWFENSSGTVINDDLEFCRKIRDAGYTIQMDLEQSLGHIGNFTVYPAQRDGVWGMVFDFGGKGSNTIFMAAQVLDNRVPA